MSLEEAFLRDIIEHPDDDVPRLVYAEWLDEHGDPARAEFIRLQCRLDREDASSLFPGIQQVRGVCMYPYSRTLSRREEELLDANRDRFLGALADMVINLNLSTDRDY